jgi:hypothetical protein
MVLMGALRSASRTAELGVSTMDSANPKTQAVMSLHVGEERKMSWSFLDRILREGVLNVQLEEVSGGVGRAGVSGMGVGLEGPERRFRGSSFGSRSLRFGIDDAAPGDEAG